MTFTQDFTGGRWQFSLGIPTAGDAILTGDLLIELTCIIIEGTKQILM
ncbi:hypothetical protein ACQKII_02850 [Lysinibacillus sp. NPDC048646]